MTEILFATQTALNSATANITTLQSYFTTGVANVANGGTGVSTKTGTGSVVLSTSPTITTPAFSFGTGSAQAIIANSNNGGYQNAVYAENAGAITNASTAAAFVSQLTAGSGAYIALSAVGSPSNPQGLLSTGAGLTGGFNVISGAGSITLSPANSTVVVNNNIQMGGVAFASLPSAPAVGMVAYVTDSTTNTWGATIAGSGSDKVLAWYNGSNWTVVGK